MRAAEALKRDRSEALLDGTPQFVVASINGLITTNQATNISRIEGLFRNQLERPSARERFMWNMLLTGWYLLALTTVITISRIGFSAMISNSKTHPVFINLDLGIVSMMGLGYLFLAMTGFVAWRLPWLGGPWERRR